MSSAPPAPGTNDVGHTAARRARAAIEEALLGFTAIPLAFDREDLRDRLLRAIQCTYAVQDSAITAVVHHAGLQEAGAMVSEVCALLRRAGDPGAVPPLGAALQQLGAAQGELLVAADAVAAIQFTRRAELTGGLADVPLPPPRPLLASRSEPELHAIVRRPLLAWVDVGENPMASSAAGAGGAAASPFGLVPSKPRTLEELAAFAEAAASGALVERLEAATAAPPAAAAPGAPPLRAFEPAIEEVELLRRLGRDCLEDIAGGRNLRKPNALESWLDQGPFEQRLLDNLDAFAAAGPAALPQVPLFLAEARSPDPERAFAAALALGSIEGSDTIGAAVMALKQSPPETFPGWIEGLTLAPNPAIDAAMADIALGPREPLAALALDVLHARAADPAGLIPPLLSRSEPSIRAHLARALATALPREEAVSMLEAMLAAPVDDAVFLAATEALLRRGHGRTRSLLREAALGGARPRSRLQEDALWLLCLAGQPSDVEFLLAALNIQASARLVRGLGRFGHVEALDALLAHLGHGEAEIAGAAAEALERMTGAGLREVVEEPWEIDLPPEAADVAGALPVPTRKVERVVRNAERWSAWLAQHARRFDARLKHRAGVPFTPIQILVELESPVTPVEGREDATLEIALVTGLRFRFSPHDWVARQRRDLGELRSRVASLRVSPGAWSLGLARESEHPATRSSSRPPRVTPLPEPPPRPSSNPPERAAHPVGWQPPLAATQAAPLEGLIGARQPLPFLPPEAISQTDELDQAPPSPSSDPDTTTTAVRPLALPQPGHWELTSYEAGGQSGLSVSQTLPPASSVPASLPFRRAVEGAAPETGSPEYPDRTLEQTSAADPHWDVVETAVAPLTHESTELRFYPTEPVLEHAVGQAAGTPEPDDIEPEVRTAPAPVAPRGPALPFGPPVRPDHESDPKRLASTLQPGLTPNSPHGEITRPVPDVARRPVLPFQPPPPPRQPISPVGSTTPAAEQPEATLSLAQYASLCAELAVFPEAAEAVFQRHGLESQEKRAAVDAAWKDRLRQDEVQYMAWEEMYRRYHVYWTRRGAGPG